LPETGQKYYVLDFRMTLRLKIPENKIKKNYKKSGENQKIQEKLKRLFYRSSYSRT